jgi:hypothetical protein
METTRRLLLVIRPIMGVTMVYYGWPKVRDPKKNAGDFDPRLRLANGANP